ncbi:MAG: hypothetical protein OFPII_00620 [Osedax symbiont Rs1]|nr:MAG: hypothetical protein OFPII_00620 [Osedax symbiont Rs1]
MGCSEVTDSGINIQVMLFVDIGRRFRNKVRFAPLRHWRSVMWGFLLRTYFQGLLQPAALIA